MTIRTVLLLLALLSVRAGLSAQNLVSVAIFLDDLDQPLHTFSADNQAVINESYALDFSGVNPGYHRVYAVVYDSNNSFSLVSQSVVLVEGESGMETLTELEYFFDEDPGIGNAEQLTISPDQFWNEALEIEAEGLAGGRHNLSIRVKNAIGDWSQSIEKVVLVEGNSGYETLNQAEYFFDEDPGFGAGISVDLNNLLSVDEQYGLEVDESLGLGVHILYLRVQDGGGQWNHYADMPVFVCSQDVPEITQDGNTLICNQTALSYQWYLNDLEIEGATSQELEAEESGVYSVYVDSGDCYNLSEPFSFTYVSVHERNGLRISVYPNPAKENLNIEASYLFEAMSIYDMQGRMVRNIALPGAVAHRISISDLKSGMYYIVLSGQGNSHRVKVLVEGL